MTTQPPLPQILPETPRWQVGTWTLTAPDGRTWQADSPLKCCGAEQRERVPPEVALKRIFDALDEPVTPDVPKLRERAAELQEKASMPWEQALELAMGEHGISLPLYQAINKLVSHIGYEGSIASDNALVSEVMDALHDLDGGTNITAAAQGGWQPIETAPRDGKKLLGLVHFAGDDLCRPFSEYSIIQWDKGFKSSICERKPQWDKQFRGDVTHWMPLPAAPGNGEVAK